ncbi:hypothetical protein BX600DRAFT_13219 [Xylariales sp. PMI_506]|nr:hypothetical protein BX600DRAFT_13219 [Xylariales sp. PMI_506]
MPFFQEDLERRESAGGTTAMASPPAPSEPTELEDRDQRLSRKHSEESIRTELCEGLIPESPRPRTPEAEQVTACSDRTELIERLKRGESPTWIPNRHLESVWSQRPVTPSRSPKPTADSPTLLPPPTITPEKRELEPEGDWRLREGLNIERPRSALHSGDFTHDESARSESITEPSNHDREQDAMGSSGHAWLATSPPRDFTPFHFPRRQSESQNANQRRPGISSLSSSLSSSFLYQPPTSPLVQSESNDDIDLTSPMEGIDISSSLSRSSNRRHTFMAVHSPTFGFASPSSISRQLPSIRPERAHPYQAHQPRRSLTSTPNFSLVGTSPQTPGFVRSRRPSYSSDLSPSPLQHASMVGSYEESILRGRMSTTPSKPLDFVAQIGVLGIGKCKSSLRCPPHVSLPFPAVFYSYSSAAHGRFKGEEGPSPYVGQVDLENGLPNQEEDARSKRKAHTRAQDQTSLEGDKVDVTGQMVAEDAGSSMRRTHKTKRRSSSPRAPPGGSYRIPEKGQIQIIIKNPNKTAVKLFLVPYDLAGMEPGTKTFIRQRSYSAGPIIDNVPELKDAGNADRPILRYLVHLHICCPSRGRYYLYKSIRVVFANRVPDGKERLQNEITLPEPRFTAYKPIRVMHPPMMSGTGPGASLAAEKASRRRSSGIYYGASQQIYEAPPHSLISERTASQPNPGFKFPSHSGPVEPIPFGGFTYPKQQHVLDGGDDTGMMDVGSPDSAQSSRTTTEGPANVPSLSGLHGTFDKYDKLNKGDAGYGGNPFSGLINGSPGVAESLLSQRLRSLGVQGQKKQQAEDSSLTE